MPFGVFYGSRAFSWGYFILFDVILGVSWWFWCLLVSLSRPLGLFGVLLGHLVVMCGVFGCLVVLLGLVSSDFGRAILP